MPPFDALFLAGLIAYAAGAGVALAGFGAPRRARIGGFSLALAGALLEIAAAVSGIGQPATTLTLPFGVPLFSWTVRLNALSAYFNLALGILGAAVSI